MGETMNNFINLNSNDQISSMNKKDLNEFLRLLNSYNLELREKLNFDNNITFGMELECEHTEIELIIESFKKINFVQKWKIKSDDSLIETKGLEFITPIYRNEKYVYTELKQVCNILNQNATIGKRAGSHIHIGAQILENEETIFNLVNLWILYEHLIFRFTNGEFLYSRPNISLYAYPLREEFGLLPIDFLSFNLKDYKNRFIDSCIRLCNIRNLKEQKYKNTIEFRCPNGTLDPVIWQNNLNFFVKFIEYTKKVNYKEICDELYNSSVVSANNYYQIFLEEAINLVDQIFDTNMDKIYFLRQYLKNNEISTIYRKCKKFTK